MKKKLNVYLGDFDRLEDDGARVFVVVTLLDLLFGVDHVPVERKEIQNKLT